MNTISELAVNAKTDKAQLLSLWLAVERLVRCWAAQYHRGSETRLHDVDDLVQAGFLALADAVEGFNEERDAGFTTYLKYHVRRHFAEVTGRRTSKRRPERYAVSLDEPLVNDSDTTRMDMLADPEAHFAYDDVIDSEGDSQAVELLMAEIDKLDDQPRRALLLTTWEGKTLKDAGNQWGYRRSVSDSTRIWQSGVYSIQRPSVY